MVCGGGLQISRHDSETNLNSKQYVKKHGLIIPVMREKSLPWWDPYSNQPYKLSAELKPRTGWPLIREYLTILATALGMAPAVLWRFWNLKAQPREVDARSFVGLSVTPDAKHDVQVQEMVEDLGVEELLVRVPTWEINRIWVSFFPPWVRMRPISRSEMPSIVRSGDVRTPVNIFVYLRSPRKCEQDFPTSSWWARQSSTSSR
jgi:hypothetical protein